MKFKDEQYNPTREEELEIEAIINCFAPDEDPRAVYPVIDSQLAILHTRSMSLIQLAGVVITVTGFSGRIIADTNQTAQLSIITGLVMVLLAATICLLFVMPVRWITSYLYLEPRLWILTALRRRARKSISFKVASVVLIIGLAFYIFAISIMLLNPEAAELNMVR